MKFLSVTIQMKAAELYSPVVLFIMLLYKVVLTLIAGLILRGFPTRRPIGSLSS